MVDKRNKQPDEVAEPPAVYGQPRGLDAPSEVLHLAHRLLQAEAGRQARMSAIIEAMLPSTEVPGPAAVLQARRNAAARHALMQEFGALTSTEVSELAGSKAANKAALAHRWKQEGRIFSVLHGTGTYFPAFQFDATGHPRPAVAGVLAALGGHVTDWQLALWFTSANGWLGGRRPVDRLEDEPEAVVAAAQREAAGLLY